MTNPHSRPELSVVSPASGSEECRDDSVQSAAPATSAGGPSPASGRGRQVPIWILLVVAVAGGLLFFAQYQRAERLSTQVDSLSAELEEASRQITAYASHLVSIRGRVGDLSDRMASLQALVNRNPLATPEGSTPAREPLAAADGAILGPVLSTPFATAPDRARGADSSPLAP